MKDETTLLPFSIEPQELVYQDRNQKIFRIIARFDGFHKEYYVSDQGQRAAVVVIRNEEVLLVRQYRLLINGLSYEIPGGKVEENETPENAVTRECMEETGIQCLSLKQLISYHPSLDIWKNYTHIYYSEESVEMEEDSSNRRVWIPLSKCIEMVFEKKIVDSLSIIALLTYHILMIRQRHSIDSATINEHDHVLHHDVGKLCATKITKKRGK